MPYVDSTAKEKFEDALKAISKMEVSSSGELNYLFTKIALIYMEGKQERYQIYNDIAGALANCSLEFYRRKTQNYETQCIKRNGDVF